MSRFPRSLLLLAALLGVLLGSPELSAANRPNIVVILSDDMGYFDPGSLCRDNTLISPFADLEYVPATYYYTDAISDHAVRFISDHALGHAEKPFFMYVAYTAAHWPMHALPKDIAKYKGKYDGGYEIGRASCR